MASRKLGKGLGQGCRGGSGLGGQGWGHGRGAGRVRAAPHLSPRVPAFTPGMLGLAGPWGPGIPPRPAEPPPPLCAPTSPVPCCAPALCCRLHGPQRSKPRCQTPGLCAVCWGQVGGCLHGHNRRHGGEAAGLFVALWRAAGPAWASTARGHPAHMGTARSWGLRALLPAAGAQGGSPGGWWGWGHAQGTRGWPQGAELCLHQPRPAGRSEMALSRPRSRCPRHVPSSL